MNVQSVPEAVTLLLSCPMLLRLGRFQLDAQDFLVTDVVGGLYSCL